MDITLKIEEIQNEFMAKNGVVPNTVILGDNQYSSLTKNIPSEVYFSSKHEISRFLGMEVLRVKKRNYISVGFTCERIIGDNNIEIITDPMPITIKTENINNRDNNSDIYQ